MSVVNDVLAHLEAAYGATLFPPMRALYAEALGKVDQRLLPEAAVRAMQKTPRRMPSVDELLAAVREEKAVRWQRAKQGTPTFNNMEVGDPPTPARREHLREALALTRRIWRGELSESEQAAAFRTLEAKWPGCGWAEAAREAERRATQQAGAATPARRNA
jgi:hypothetical protein